MAGYKIIPWEEALEPLVFEMPCGSHNPLDCQVYTQREYKYLQQLRNGGITIRIKKRKQ